MAGAPQEPHGIPGHRGRRAEGVRQVFQPVALKMDVDFYRVFGIQKNKNMSDYLKLLKQLETLGKVKILNYSRFFFKYELVRFSEIKFNAKSNVNILEKFKS